MKNWPTLTNIKQLRGFLGLTGYYRKFIKNFANVSRPLTQLLKKGAFKWSEEAQNSFVALQLAMTQALVLALPDFTKPFVVETNASGVGIGAMLQQNGHPIAYLSKTLAPKHQTLSIYEKEFLAVMMALEKWRRYLLDSHFIIKTDHYSLKYLLDQRITTPAQMKWLPKLMGFDYEVQYKKGVDNAVADALSRVQNEGQLMSTMVMTVPTELFTKIVASWTSDESIQTLLQSLQSGKTTRKHYSWSNGYGRSFWGKSNHSQDEFYALLEGYEKDIKKFVHECINCQRNKPDLAAYPGLLQPLPIPNRIWESISMDFIKALPKSQGYTVIFVVVDRLTKYAHFMPLSHPFTAVEVAQEFLDTVYKLHGLPTSIVSDRDKVFLSNFWKELFKLLQVKLLMSTAYHPQTDGQTEVVNRCLECYLRCMIGERPKEWKKWLNCGIIQTSILPFKLLPLRQFMAKHHQFMFLIWELKLCQGSPPLSQVMELPSCNKEGLMEPEPIALLDRKMVKRNNAAVVYGLIQWANGSKDDATWELLEKLYAKFPAFVEHS
ncbi:putative mitochondrial protein [Tanacetum coccineum]